MAGRRSSGAGNGLPLPARRPVEEADGGLLRRRWRSIMGRRAPKTLSPALMARILTWREQVVQVGDISPRSRVILAAAIHGVGQQAEAGGEPEAGLIAKRSQRFEPIRSGTVLVREHAGVLHRITVASDGFEWNGRIFWEPLRRRPRHHRRQLERAPLLRSRPRSAGRGRPEQP